MAVQTRLTAYMKGGSKCKKQSRKATKNDTKKDPKRKSTFRGKKSISEKPDLIVKDIIDSIIEDAFRTVSDKGITCDDVIPSGMSLFEKSLNELLAPTPVTHDDGGDEYDEANDNDDEDDSNSSNRTQNIMHARYIKQFEECIRLRGQLDLLYSDLEDNKRVIKTQKKMK